MYDRDNESSRYFVKLGNQTLKIERNHGACRGIFHVHVSLRSMQ